MHATSTTLPAPTAPMPGALDAPTMCAAFQQTAAAHAGDVALRSFDGTLELTWADYADRVRRLAGGLSALGVRPASTVGLLLTNRPEAALADTATMHLGAVPFSIYATSAPEQVAFVLRDAAARIVVTERALLPRLDAAAVEHGVELEQVIVVDGPGGTLTLAEAEGRPARGGFDFEAAWRAVAPDDLVTLIYTSGTTGPPKGVELMHRNVLAAWRGMEQAWAIRSEPDVLRELISYLPTAHIADRFSSHYAAMVWGSTVTYAPDPSHVAALMPCVRPTVVAGVPRVWEKLRAGVTAALAAAGEERRMAADAAIAAAVERLRMQQRGEPVPPELEAACEAAEAQLFAGIRGRLGLDRCRVAISAGAPAPLHVLEFFHAIGLPVLEVYGLSETCAVTTANPMDRPRLGTVGCPIPGVEMRLLDDGELLVRSETVMRGYRNRPDATAGALDGDGWLHTGDIAEIDGEGYVRIVDRKKELILNAAGKNMSPANIEAALTGADALIGQACCVGDGRPYNVALLTLDPDAAAAFAVAQGLAPEVGTVARDGRVRAAVAEAVANANERLSRPEQIKRHLLLDHEWVPGGPLLTPTMKLRRRSIAERYAAEIELLYGAPA